jgi:hypothetical protein
MKAYVSSKASASGGTQSPRALVDWSALRRRKAVAGVKFEAEEINSLKKVPLSGG